MSWKNTDDAPVCRPQKPHAPDGCSMHAMDRRTGGTAGLRKRDWCDGCGMSWDMQTSARRCAWEAPRGRAMIRNSYVTTLHGLNAWYSVILCYHGKENEPRNTVEQGEETIGGNENVSRPFDTYGKASTTSVHSRSRRRQREDLRHVLLYLHSTGRVDGCERRVETSDAVFPCERHEALHHRDHPAVTRSAEVDA